MNLPRPVGGGRRHWRPLAVLLSTVLGAGALTPSVWAAGTANQDGSTVATPSAEGRAQVQARATGRPVEVVEKRDEFTEVLANPDGTFTWRQHIRPVHAKVGGEWKTPDATLRATADGVSPVASTFPMTFSGGGSGPLATMVRDGKSVSLSWPTALPKPELAGSTALYREVMPGVDLKVLAETDGFVHHLIVKSREAAADPRLATLTYGLKSDGVTVAAEQGGGLAAKDGSGAVLFRAPAPTMWDSSHLKPAAAPAPRMLKTAPAPAAAPQVAGEGDAPVEAKKMPVKVSGSSLQLTTDKTLLTAADTVFPVTVDPAFSGGGRVNWTMAYKQKYNGSAADTSYWNGDHFSDKLPRVGYEDDANYATYGTARSFFQMDTKGLAGAQVVGATFNVFNNYTWSCTATPVELGFTGAIAPSTTWNSQPGWSQTLQEKSFAHGRTGCGAAGEDFNSDALKQLVQRAADGNWNDITLGLRSRGDYEGNDLSWKKFNSDPHLEVTYNRAPVVNESGAYEGPWSPGSTSAKAIACTTDPATWPTIGNNDVTLTARVSDPDGTNVTAHFGLWQDNGPGIQSADPQVASGTWAQTTVAANKLTDGQRYRWAANAQDGYATSPNTPECGFNVDRSGPTKPVVTAADSGDKPARVERTLKLSSTDAFALDGYCYSLNKPLATDNTKCSNGTWVAAGADKSATIKVVPTLWPTNQLYVRAYDKAGNASPYNGGTDSTQIKAAGNGFVLDPTSELSGDRPGDLDGDGQPDLVNTDPDGALRLYGGTGKATVYPGRTIGSGNGWRGALVAHRGDFASPVSGQTRDGYEDFIVKLGSQLFVYPNDGLGNPQADKRIELKHPTSTWNDATQILAVGNIDQQMGNDLLVKEGDSLVLYSGDETTGTFRQANGRLLPTPVAASGWAAYDLVAAGDLDADGVTDLLARNATTDPANPEFGKLYLVPGSVPAQGQYQLGAKTQYAAAGWDRGNRPVLVGLGNLHGTVTDDNGTRTYTATPGQEAPDLLSTTKLGTPVSYRATDGSTQSSPCTTACLTANSLAGNGPDALPSLVGTGGWAAYAPSEGTNVGTATERTRTAGANGTVGGASPAATVPQTTSVSSAGRANGDVAHVIVSNGREFIQWHRADGSWSGIDLIDTTSTAGTRFTDTTQVAVAFDGTDRLQVLSLGSGQLHHQTWTQAGGWTRFDQPTTVTGVTAIAAAGLKDGSAQFMSVIGGVEYNQARWADGTWSGFNLLGNSGVTAVAAAATPDGTAQFMSVVGGVEYHQARYANGSWSGFNRLGNANVTDVAGAGNADGSALFVSRTADGGQQTQLRNLDGSWTALAPVATGIRYVTAAGHLTAPAGAPHLNTNRTLGLTPQ